MNQCWQLPADGAGPDSHGTNPMCRWSLWPVGFKETSLLCMSIHPMAAETVLPYEIREAQLQCVVPTEKHSEVNWPAFDNSYSTHV